jgi:hypothetical protein
MHRRYLSWLVSLLLVLAQHGAALHELGHLSHSARSEGATLRAGMELLENQLCPTCQAFSQIANPATARAIPVGVTPAAIIPASDPRYAIVSAEAPTPRSRGPPQV